MPRKEVEATIHCTQCGHEYGTVYRVLVGDHSWAHETVPASIPKYCTLCERPVERKHG